MVATFWRKKNSNSASCYSVREVAS